MRPDQPLCPDQRCPLRCNWCDSMHAVDPHQIQARSTPMTPEAVVAAVAALPKAPLGSVDGGNPVAWDLTKVVLKLKVELGYKIAVKTQGANRTIGSIMSGLSL